ncbi:SurA N-terminal domain-containing protein [Rickettsia endosymbiont of Cardiosporidium cionae]|uniref:SurA N-terminal domain-containing protein n=1 Tax=Rickettsia endosymbiont of Cardiosporidium cionae TaxID=2777155 RepID=UPI00189461E0|nr:SurA N-terminal domain-containing protein [Rickettsia endosymbiont of Cardiosporidium cionae]KAF8818170.1 hypothetical protein IHI24_000622 [Rickettsia endosymbiont of Cardiosporidium cionae]
MRIAFFYLVVELLLSLMMFGITTYAKPEDSEIVAVVDEYPVTMHEINTTQNFFLVISGIDTLSKKDVLESIIDNLIIIKYAEQQAGITINNADIEHAISIMEQQNKLKPGTIQNIMKDRNIEEKLFHKIIKADLILSKIISSPNLFSTSSSINFSQKDIHKIQSDSSNFDVKFWSFISKDNSKDSIKKLTSLQKTIQSCDKINENLYKQIIDTNYHNCNSDVLDKITKVIIKDIEIGTASSIFKNQHGNFQLIFLCDKKFFPDQSSDSQVILSNMLERQRSSQFQNFLTRLRDSTYIKILVDL